MSIECYYTECPLHSCHEPGQEGPFCDEAECSATEEQIKRYEKERQEYLKKRSI